MTEKRGRGRPVTVDADAVAAVAMELFRERGFDKVTMAEIAEAAGIGRRTVFRYFPSKFALVWGGAAELNENILRALSEEDSSELSTGAVIANAYRSSYKKLPQPILDLARSRMQIIHQNPEVYAYGHARWLEDHGQIAGFIAEREGRQSTDLEVVIRAAMVSSITFSALFWWAEREDADFFETMNRAFDKLERRLDPVR